MNLEERFKARVERRGEEECWPWTGKINRKDGYGRFSLGRRGSEVLAHRAAYEFAHGPIPDRDLEGHQVCVLHRCDNPPCCNPGHLFTGTRADNVRDMDSKGRGRRVGPSSGRSSTVRLTASDVRQIRARAAAGESQAKIAEDFPVTRGAVWQIVHRKTWKDL